MIDMEVVSWDDNAVRTVALIELKLDKRLGDSSGISIFPTSLSSLPIVQRLCFFFFLFHLYLSAIAPP